jgi:hypothetical protein
MTYELNEELIEKYLTNDWFSAADLTRPKVKKISKFLNTQKFFDLMIEKKNASVPVLNEMRSDSFNPAAIWNKLVRELKAKYMTHIMDNLYDKGRNFGFSEQRLDQLQLLLMALLVGDAFFDGDVGDFYEKVNDIFLSGHMFYNWSGNKEDFSAGVFEVY